MKKPAFHPFAMMQLPLNDDEPEEKKQPAPKKDPLASKVTEHEPVKPAAEVAGPSFQPVEEPAPQSESTNISMKPTAFGLGGPKKLPSAPSSIFELTEEQSKRPSFVPRSLTTAPSEPAKNIPSKSAAIDEKPTDEPINKGDELYDPTMSMEDDDYTPKHDIAENKYDVGDVPMEKHDEEIPSEKEDRKMEGFDEGDNDGKAETSSKQESADFDGGDKQESADFDGGDKAEENKEEAMIESELESKHVSPAEEMKEAIEHSDDVEKVTD